ncbi:MAG: hypothetical protein R3C26_02500 [Calditrichia bacterium]
MAEYLPEVRWDGRVRSFRAPAFRYREIAAGAAKNNKLDYRDDARISRWLRCRCGKKSCRVRTKPKLLRRG